MLATVVMLFGCKPKEEPFVQDNDYLPELCRLLVGLDTRVAQDTLIRQDFVRDSSVGGQEILFSKVFSDKREDLGKWQIDLNSEDTAVSTVVAYQSATPAQAAELIERWDVLSSRHHANYSLWRGTITTADTTLTYTDGQAITMLKGAIATAFALKQLTDEQYEELMSKFALTRADYLIALKTADFAAQGSGCSEVFVNKDNSAESSLIDFLSDNGTKSHSLTGMSYITGHAAVSGGSASADDDTGSTQSPTDYAKSLTTDNGATFFITKGKLSDFLSLEDLENLTSALFPIEQ